MAKEALSAAQKIVSTKLGTPVTLAHTVHPNYVAWGRTGNTTLTSSILSDAEQTDLYRVCQRLQLPLMDYQMVQSAQVHYYQGTTLAEANVIYIRFEKSEAIHYGHEHMSVIYNPQAKHILGLTRQYLSAPSLPTHQQALTAACEFLKIFAPDLMAQSTFIPEVISADADTKVEFAEPIVLDKLELQWIGKHSEVIQTAKGEQEISGMKVKFFIPASNLWAWVIVDGNGAIQTFERNISWNFARMQRQTQMWLHDQWLKKLDI